MREGVLKGRDGSEWARLISSLSAFYSDFFVWTRSNRELIKLMQSPRFRCELPVTTRFATFVQ